MKSRKSEKRKESATVRRTPVSRMCFLTAHKCNVTKCTVTKRRGTVFVHRSQLMTLGTFQAGKFGGSKGGPGASAASWGRSEVPGVGGR